MCEIGVYEVVHGVRVGVTVGMKWCVIVRMYMVCDIGVCTWRRWGVRVGVTLRMYMMVCTSVRRHVSQSCV